jgi:Ser-tRNA(Ala) deacylase AlaX
MTEKVFWQNPYLTTLETRVSSVNSNEITLEQTIFYAFSGGQESDAGTIGEKQILEARKEGKEIIYGLEGNHGLVTGESVTVKIDWERRYQLMRLHFAAELILELMYKHVPGVEKIGAHIAEDKARVDFALSENVSSFFPILQEEAQKLITANHTIISAFSNEEEQKRYWEIASFAQVPCGGTHLKQTGEIGNISLKRKNIGKSKERIEIYVAS